MEWQPIETAPKDGNEFLVALWGEDFGTVQLAVVFWNDNNPTFPWCTADGPGYHLDAATHWMPLPNPPVTQ